MKKKLASFIAAMALGCSAQSAEPIASEELALPVTIGAPHGIQARCDAATCNGLLTITQTVPAGIGNVEIWDATLWLSSGNAMNYLPPLTTLVQSSGRLVTTTRVSSFRQNEIFSLLTSVVIRNPNGEILGGPSQPVLNNGQLQLQPSSVTAVVTP